MPVSLLENQLLRQIGNPFPRSPEQRNQLLESDAELIRMADGSTLALTTDCIAEEIQTGLYSDPEHIGWMTVAVNMSDLAAVGARPLGLLLSESLPPGFPSEKLIALQNGIAADADFYRGKLAACRWFYRWELPKVRQWHELLRSLDDTTLTMPPESF